MHENNCPWDEGACAEAASTGNLEILKYLHENGAEINSRNNYGNTALNLAFKKGIKDITKYLIDNGADINEELSYLLSNANFNKSKINKNDYIDEDSNNEDSMDVDNIYDNPRNDRNLNEDQVQIFYYAKYLAENGANVDKSVFIALKNGYFDLAKGG